MLRFFASVLLAFLPPRYRPKTGMRPYAIVSALAEIGLAILGLILRIFTLATAPPVLPGNPMELFLKHGGVYVQAGAVAGFADFWLNPINLFLYYLVFEGMIRLMAAMAGDDFIGTLPLYAVSALHGLKERAAHKRHLGDLVGDQIVRGGNRQSYDLKVYSCRPKTSWNPYMTIEFESRFYQLFKEEQGPGPRRFIYFLRKNPTGRIVVVIERYDVDDVLKPARDKTGAEQLRDNLISMFDSSDVKDDVVRGGDRSGYDVKIACAKPKLDWDSNAAIEFENCLYEMFKEERGAKPRRFTYYLRKNPAGRAVMVTRQYRPN